MNKPALFENAVCLSRIVIVACLVLLAGCVSTSDSRFVNNTNEAEALRKFTELGLLHIQKGNTVDAMPPLKRALEIDPKSAEVNVALAMLFQAENDKLLAQKYFDKALQYSDGVNRTRIRNNYAGFLFQADRLMDACEQLRLASEDAFYDKRAQVYENLGVCYQRLGKKTEALAAYEQAVSIEDTRAKALLEAASLQFDRNNLRQSGLYHESYQRLVRYRFANDTPKSLWLGVQLSRDTGDLNAEASYALKLRNLFPESPENKDILKGG